MGNYKITFANYVEKIIRKVLTIYMIELKSILRIDIGRFLVISSDLEKFLCVTLYMACFIFSIRARSYLELYSLFNMPHGSWNSVEIIDIFPLIQAKYDNTSL